MRACECNEPLRRLDSSEKLLALIDRATKLADNVLRQTESDNERLRALERQNSELLERLARLEAARPIAASY